MSSMRNAIQRRVHRERGQPEERKKWGLLEKHKDYSARARDFNAKKKKLKDLRQKVLEKNPDEFYFGMMSRSGPSTGRQGTGTVDGDRGNKVLSQDAVRLFKTQDLGYIRTARNKAVKEVAALEMAAKGITGQGQKTIFISEVSDDMHDDIFEDEDHEEENKVPIMKDEQFRRDKRKRQSEKVETRLTVALERLKTLTEAENALEMQRAKMSKSPTVGGITKHGLKFQVRERKR